MFNLSITFTVKLPIPKLGGKTNGEKIDKANSKKHLSKVFKQAKFTSCNQPHLIYVLSCHKVSINTRSANKLRHLNPHLPEVLPKID